jgi:hypothetical protein
VPGGANGSLIPPTVAWYALTPGTPPRNPSTFCVSASVSASVELSGIVIAIGNCGLDDWSSRLTRRNGISAIDPPKIKAAMPSVSRRCPVAQRIVGT